VPGCTPIICCCNNTPCSAPGATKCLKVDISGLPDTMNFQNEYDWTPPGGEVVHSLAGQRDVTIPNGTFYVPYWGAPCVYLLIAPMAGEDYFIDVPGDDGQPISGLNYCFNWMVISISVTNDLSQAGIQIVPLVGEEAAPGADPNVPCEVFAARSAGIFPGNWYFNKRAGTANSFPLILDATALPDPALWFWNTPISGTAMITPVDDDDCPDPQTGVIFLPLGGPAGITCGCNGGTISPPPSSSTSSSSSSSSTLGSGSSSGPCIGCKESYVLTAAGDFGTIGVTVTCAGADDNGNPYWIGYGAGSFATLTNNGDGSYEAYVSASGCGDCCPAVSIPASIGAPGEIGCPQEGSYDIAADEFCAGRAVTLAAA
jgi:hypothetical protein